MQQEILVILRSSLTNNQLIKEVDDEPRKLTPEEKLEEACANGLIKEILPEVFQNAEYKAYLWQMQPGFSFLQLELGEAPLQIDVRYSVNPHNFLFTKCYN